eukprot:64752-Chlamydomonas_euryale.AAC.5
MEMLHLRALCTGPCQHSCVRGQLAELWKERPHSLAAWGLTAQTHLLVSVLARFRPHTSSNNTNMRNIWSLSIKRLIHDAGHVPGSRSPGPPLYVNDAPLLVQAADAPVAKKDGIRGSTQIFSITGALEGLLAGGPATSCDRCRRRGGLWPAISSYGPPLALMARHERLWPAISAQLMSASHARP